MCGILQHRVDDVDKYVLSSPKIGTIDSQLDGSEKPKREIEKKTN